MKMQDITEIYNNNRFDSELDEIIKRNIRYWDPNLYERGLGGDFPFLNLILSRKTPDYYWLDRLITHHYIEPDSIIYNIEQNNYTSEANIIFFIVKYKSGSLEQIWDREAFDCNYLELAIRYNLSVFYIIKNNKPVPIYFLERKMRDLCDEYISDSFLFKLFRFAKKQGFKFTTIDLEKLLISKYILPANILEKIFEIFDIDPNSVELGYYLKEIPSKTFMNYIPILIRFGIDIKRVMNFPIPDQDNDRIRLNVYQFDKFVNKLRGIIRKWRVNNVRNKKKRVNNEIKYLPGLGIGYQLAVEHFREICTI